jgi:MFS family permease
VSVSRLDLDLLELGHFGFFRSRISCKAWDTLSLLFTYLVGVLGYVVFHVSTTLIHFLPVYARTLGFSALTGSLIVALLNTASVPGVVLLSAFCDRTNVTNVIFVSALGSTLSVFLLWGLSTSLPAIIVFAITYGFFAGGFTSTYAGTVKELRRVSTGSDLGSIFGLLSAGRGIGNVICGPISETLLGQGPWYGKALFAYGSAYGPLITFTGITAALTLMPWVTKRLHII